MESSSESDRPPNHMLLTACSNLIEEAADDVLKLLETMKHVCYEVAHNVISGQELSPEDWDVYDKIRARYLELLVAIYLK